MIVLRDLPTGGKSVADMPLPDTLHCPKQTGKIQSHLSSNEKSVDEIGNLYGMCSHS